MAKNIGTIDENTEGNINVTWEINVATPAIDGPMSKAWGLTRVIMDLVEHQQLIEINKALANCKKGLFQVMVSPREAAAVIGLESNARFEWFFGHQWVTRDSESFGFVS